MSNKDIDEYDSASEDPNRWPDECSGSENPLSRKGCADVFAKLIGLLFSMVFVFGSLMWLNHNITFPITDRPTGVWAPVVNPVSTSVGSYIPAVYMAEFPNGDRCYVAVGILVDQTSCIAGVE